MADGYLDLTINGIDRGDKILRGGTFTVSKRLGNESFTFTVTNDVYSSLAYSPVNGDDILAYDSLDLIFGGQVRKRRRYRQGGSGPTMIDITCRGYEFLAEQVFITGEIASGPLFTQAYAIFTAYLQPKGCTWLGPTTGGPTIPKIVYRNASVASVLTRMCKPVNRFWRINGTKQVGLIAPGDLPFPQTMYGTDFETGLTIEDDHYELATRLLLTTGGTGDLNHSETHTGNGLKTYFLVNVEPKPDEVDADGVVTETFVPTQVIVNGVTHAIGGGIWSWDSVNHAAYKSGAAVPNGHTVVIAYVISLPAIVRTWLPSLLTSTGQINVAVQVDKSITIGHITDVSEAAAWGAAELDFRSTAPRIIRGSTTVKGFYPALTGTVNIANDNVNASFLVQAVTIKDPERSGKNNTNFLLYDLELIEGDTPGRHWSGLFGDALNSGNQGGGVVMSSSGGAPSGGTAPPPVTSSLTGDSLYMGGFNGRYVPASTTWRPIPEAVPQSLGGASMAGNWTLRVYAFLLAAGTLQIRLASGGSPIAGTTINITTVSDLTTMGFGSGAISFTAPGVMTDMLLEYAVTAGTNNVVIGHCRITKD